jgi:hypothetical protein
MCSLIQKIKSRIKLDLMGIIVWILDSSHLARGKASMSLCPEEKHSESRIRTGKLAEPGHLAEICFSEVWLVLSNHSVMEKRKGKSYLAD